VFQPANVVTIQKDQKTGSSGLDDKSFTPLSGSIGFVHGLKLTKQISLNQAIFMTAMNLPLALNLKSNVLLCAVLTI